MAPLYFLVTVILYVRTGPADALHFTLITLLPFESLTLPAPLTTASVLLAFTAVTVTVFTDAGTSYLNAFL